jgi:cytochrome P450
MMDPSDQDRFQANTHHPVFAQLRKEDPVHFCDSERFGPYWSITRYADILSVEKNHRIFSSAMARGGVTIRDNDFDDVLDLGASFITMDPPDHTVCRAKVSDVFTPQNLKHLDQEIRHLVSRILAGLPVGEDFDWVAQVANLLPIQVLASLFGVPQEDGHLLLRWSNLMVGTDDPDVVSSREVAREELRDFVDYFINLWNQRAAQAPRLDLVSMLVHGAKEKPMTQAEYIGTMVLLLIGGNDTTRNTISGGLWALMQHPDQYQGLRDDPAHIGTTVSEMIRWVTPIAHFRRTAVSDVEVGGKLIKRGEKVVMWYVSGNRDETVFEEADSFRIDRRSPRHLSFGAGIHHCIGWRLAEMQLTALWQALLPVFPVIEPVTQPSRLWSNFTHGIKDFQVRIPPP